MKLTTVDCLCGSKDFKVLHHRPYAGEGALAADFLATTDCFDNYGRIVRCRSCSLVYTNPRPDDSAVSHGYADSEDRQYSEQSANRSINAHISIATIRRFSSGGRLLEVGCAMGYFLNAARTDFAVEGVELSRWAAAEAKRRFGLPVRAGTIAGGDFASESFDVVALIDVIEHLTDPVRMIEDCRRLLKPGGLLYIVTPDIDSFSARVLRGQWWGLRPAHIYYFSRQTLSRLIESRGFEISLVRSFGRIFTMGYWVSRLKNYPWFIHRPLALAFSALDLGDKILYLNTRDTMELVAKKSA